MAEPQCSYCYFSNFGLIYSYFVLVTIIIFDLALHICIYIIHAEYFWQVMAGFTEKFVTLILKLVYITFCLLMKPQTMLQLKIFDGIDLIYCKVSFELLHSVHSLLICAKLHLIWSISQSWNFFGSLHLPWSLFLNCSYFLGNLSLSVLIKCVLIKKVYRKTTHNYSHDHF